MALSEKHIQEIEARGLDPELLVKLGVDGFSMAATRNPAVKIPFVKAGKVVNHKYRPINGSGGDPEKPMHQDADAVKCFWNYDVITDEAMQDQPLIITEGEFDAMAAIQCGFARTVSVPDGAPPKAIGAEDVGEKYSYVRDAQHDLAKVREIILAVDGDERGANLLHDLSHRLGRVRCKFVRYPKGCKDLNDALKAYGPKGVQETIRRAAFIKVNGVYSMSELPPAPPAVVYDIGIPCVSDHLKIRMGDVCVITGIPGHGKTAFANFLTTRMVEQYGWKAAFASFEQEPTTDHRRNLRTIFAGKFEKHMSQAEIEAADEWIERHFVFLVPDEDDDVTLDWVLERAAAAAVQRGARMIVIDPWNEMDHDRPKDMSLTEYTSFAIKQFRKFARKYQVHVTIIAHPTKLKKQASGAYEIPGPYDIADSAGWFNKLQHIVIVHREGDRTLIRVNKSKYHEIIGVPGDEYASFSPHSNRFMVEEPEMMGEILPFGKGA